MANTEVILRTKIDKLGVEADVVKVRRGYARNFLIPQGKAFEATKGNLRHLESLKAARAEREAAEFAEAQRIASKLKRVKFNTELATGETGKAFGSITVVDLVALVEGQTGVKLDRHDIKLDKPIKTTGKHNVTVRLHPEVLFDLRVFVNDKEDEAAEEGAEETEG